MKIDLEQADRYTDRTVQELQEHCAKLHSELNSIKGEILDILDSSVTQKKDGTQQVLNGSVWRVFAKLRRLANK